MHITIDFNRDWIFRRENGEAKTIQLPHDAMLEEPRSCRNRNGKITGYYPGGRYRYEKTFTIESIAADDVFLVHFGGVYGRTSVLVNRVPAREHAYGYTEFEVDITAFCRAGENVIEVIADNTLVPNSRWYTGSGIYRTVQFIRRKKNAITGVRIQTLAVEPARIELSCSTPEAEVEILDAEGKTVAAGRSGELMIPDAVCWSAETPYLYTARIRTDSDCLETRFGIRLLRWSAQKGLEVNGKSVKLRGGCLHHDNGVLGACAFADAEYRKIRILKEAGYNAIRSSHNPCSAELLDACDELGMYVLDEAFDGWYIPKNYHDYSRVFRQEYQNDLTAMVQRDFNHPSVILYSIGNEVSEVGFEEGRILAKEMAEQVRSLDPTRPVTCGINIMLTVWATQGMGVYRDKGEYSREPLEETDGKEAQKSGSAFYNAVAQKLGTLMSSQTKTKKAGAVVDRVADSFDILGLNYGQQRYDLELRNHPERILLGTETYIHDLSYNWQRVVRSPALIGDFCWTAFDYIGEAEVGAWRYASDHSMALLAGSGSIDILGNPDCMNTYQKVVWGLEDIGIGVRPVDHGKDRPLPKAWRFTNAVSSWNWQGCEGAPATVEVFSRGETCTLELNGKRLGRKKVKNNRATFRCTYQPGILMARAFDAEGKELAGTCLRSGTGSAVLKLLPERTSLRANGQDLSYIHVQIASADGTVCPCGDEAVKCRIEGPAALQGAGSARPFSDRGFHPDSFVTYQGRGLIVVRSLYEKGQAVLTVETESGQSEQICLEIV